MSKFFSSTIAVALLGSSAGFAAIVTLPNDPIFGVQLVNFTISLATEGGNAGVNNFPANEAPNFSIDANNGSKYLNFAEFNTGVVVDPANDLLVVTGLQLVTGNDAPERDPATFSIYGTNVSQSTNFSDYTAIVLNRPILTTDPGRGGSSPLVTFTNAANAPFDSYLVVFPTVRDAGAANSMQVAEIRLDGTTPIPEPGTWTLLGLATVGLATLRRRRS